MRRGQLRLARALVADSKETWVCSYLSLALLLGVGAYAVLGWWWADPLGALAMLPVILQKLQDSLVADAFLHWGGRDGRRWLKRASQ